MEREFIINQLIKLLIVLSAQYSTGLLVKFKRVKVNYTRKIIHFLLIFVPVYLDRIFAYRDSPQLFALSALLTVLLLAIYIKPFRTRIPLIETMFRSFDRPEDRPYTLLWLSTQIIASFMVIIPVALLYAHYGLLDLILIPILITGIGDGLAEPVGVRFGRHKYYTHALFTKKRYTRTYEGSACILLTSLVTLVFYNAHFSPEQLVAALLIIPPLMTITEAFSPHTWDNPFLFLVGYLALFGISFI